MEIGKEVFVKLKDDKNAPSERAVIHQQLNTRSYIVNVKGNLYRRNMQDISKPIPATDDSEQTIEDEIATTDESQNSDFKDANSSVEEYETSSSEETPITISSSNDEAPKNSGDNQNKQTKAAKKKKSPNQQGKPKRENKKPDRYGFPS